MFKCHCVKVVLGDANVKNRIENTSADATKVATAQTSRLKRMC